jgi:hypothetical protein
MESRFPEPSLPEDDVTPPTEPKGFLVPPPRVPPTAVSAAAAGPEPRPPRPVRSWSAPPERLRRRSGFVQALNRALDLVDAAADELRVLGKTFASTVMGRRPAS